MIDVDLELEDCTFMDDFKKLIHRLDRQQQAMAAKLEDAADLMADLGRIHNTPFAKREWIDGN